MKAAVAVASLATLVGRCGGLDFPGGIDDVWHHHDHGHGHGDHEPPADDVCDPQPSAAEEDAGVVDYDCGPPGLYRDRSFRKLATGVVPYTPSYELWADGAEKERFIYLPDDTQIDTSNPNRWSFPVGTRIYKTFSLNGVKLETRRFEKVKEPAGFDSWTLVAYAWSKDQRTVRLADSNGEGNVLGTDHDIPSQAQCKSCHNQTGLDIVNGFEAIQLNHEGRGWTLAHLIETNRLVNSAGAQPNVTVDNARIPGDEVEQNALGYLNANCAICHRGERPDSKLKFDLRVDVGLTSVHDTEAYKLAASCAPLTSWIGKPTPDDHYGNYAYIFDPGSPLTSAVIGRMSIRAGADVEEVAGQRLVNDQMPKFATEVADEQGIEDVSRWIEQLDVQCPIQNP